jgi:hypothetical protein
VTAASNQWEHLALETVPFGNSFVPCKPEYPPAVDDECRMPEAAGNVTDPSRLPSDITLCDAMNLSLTNHPESVTPHPHISAHMGGS